MRRLALAAALLFAAAPLAAQAPTIPEEPNPGFPTSYFDESPYDYVAKRYRFRGCSEGPAFHQTTGAVIAEVPLCVNGRLTFGVHRDEQRAVMTFNLRQDPRLGTLHVPEDRSGIVVFATYEYPDYDNVYFLDLRLQEPLFGTGANYAFTYVFDDYVPFEYLRVSSGGVRFDFNDGTPFPNGAGVDFEFTTIPEPGTWALVGAGLAGVLGVARRRRA